MLKVLAEKPQFKSLSDDRDVLTDTTFCVLPKNLIFHPEVTLWYLCSKPRTLSLWVTCLLGLREPGSALRFTWKDYYKGHQESRWHVCSMTLFKQGGASHTWVGFSLHGEALPWLKPGRHWAHCRKWGAVFMGCKGLPAKSSRHSFPAGRNVHHANHSQPGLETTESLTPRAATMEVVGTSDIWLTAYIGISPSNQISGRISNFPRRLVPHTAFLLAFKMPGLLRNKVTDGHFTVRPTTFAVLFWLKQPCRISHIRSLWLEAGVSYIYEPAQVTDPDMAGSTLEWIHISRIEAARRRSATKIAEGFCCYLPRHSSSGQAQEKKPSDHNHTISKIGIKIKKCPRRCVKKQQNYS